MIFLGYDFVWFAAAFFGVYIVCSWPKVRLALIVMGGIAFQIYYGGLASIALVAILATITFAASHTAKREFILAAIIRIAIGFLKKWAADNLTGWIEFAEPQFASHNTSWRWLFLAALAFRILLDFSGYNDMAIGYARMMGIVVPENFNWPYLARSPMEFWQRWHMSLSLWIRDYIYIPLGGNRLGVPRRVVNALAAMAICGLWHGLRGISSFGASIMA